MTERNIPKVFRLLLSDMCIDKPDIAGTSDGFFVVNKSIANILSVIPNSRDRLRFIRRLQKL